MEKNFSGCSFGSSAVAASTTISVGTSRHHEDESNTIGGRCSADTWKSTCGNMPANERSFSETMDELRKCVWYWGPVSWQEAERVLKNRPNGSFILRDSTSDRYIFSLSCKTKDSVIHARIPQHAGKFCYGGPRSLLTSESILEFIRQTIQRSEDGKLHFFVHPKKGEDQAENIRLLFPLSRNSVLPSLKHLCRFEILSRIRPDHVDCLNLPEFLKNYLRNPKYIAEVPSN